MTRKFHAQWLALSLSLLVLCTAPAYAASISPSVSVSTPTQEQLNPQTVLDRLAQSRVVYLGETHNSEADHRAQLELIKALYARSPNWAIALEMFQRPFQTVIDRYLAGQITEQELRSQTQYDRRWGYPWEFYAPILRFAKENKLKVVALNAPTEVTRKVARGGLKPLTISDRRYIPPLSEIRAEPDSYRAKLRELFDGIHRGRGSSLQFENFFLAQVLWDETMADRVSQFLNQNPKTQVVVLTGQGHVAYGYGIPSRVTRRNRQVKQAIVLLNPSAELKSEKAIADYFWTTSPAGNK